MDKLDKLLPWVEKLGITVFVLSAIVIAVIWYIGRRLEMTNELTGKLTTVLEVLAATVKEANLSKMREDIAVLLDRKKDEDEGHKRRAAR